MDLVVAPFIFCEAIGAFLFRRPNEGVQPYTRIDNMAFSKMTRQRIVGGTYSRVEYSIFHSERDPGIDDYCQFRGSGEGGKMRFRPS